METLWIQEKFCPLCRLEEFKLGVFIRIRIIARDQFYLSGPSMWQGKHPITQHLLFLLSCNDLPVLGRPLPLTRNGIQISFYLSVFELLMFVEPP